VSGDISFACKRYKANLDGFFIVFDAGDANDGTKRLFRHDAHGMITVCHNGGLEESTFTGLIRSGLTTGENSSTLCTCVVDLHSVMD